MSAACGVCDDRGCSACLPTCDKCSDSGWVTTFFQNDAGEADDSSDFCTCAAGKREEAAHVARVARRQVSS